MKKYFREDTFSQRHMRPLFIALFISFISCATPVQAQDILYKRDSIRCKILKVTAGEYVYAYLDSNNMLVQTSVPKRFVDSVKYKRYPADTALALALAPPPPPPAPVTVADAPAAQAPASKVKKERLFKYKVAIPNFFCLI